jgi:hypothetical protein
VIGVDHQMSGSRVANVRPSTVCLPTEKQGTPAAGNLNHFKGYRGKRTRAPVFPASLDGDLGSQQAKFYRYAAVMTPVDVDGAGMVDPTAHLMCLELVYRDRGFEIPEPSFTSQEVTIENELGTQTIEITKPDALCLPSLRTYTLP